MPPRTPKSTPLGREVVRRLRDSIQQKAPSDYIGLLHRVPVQPRSGGVPVMFTFEVSCSPGGLHVATCHEFPGIAISGDDEHEVLVLAEMRVRQLLADG